MDAAVSAQRVQHLGFGPLYMARYALHFVGSKVAMHTHAATDPGHITLVARGRIRASGPGFSHELKAGDVYDFNGREQTHELVALDADTVIFNIRKADSTAFNRDVVLEMLGDAQ